eukprot:c25467_g1_i1 orf=1369-1638(+)
MVSMKESVLKKWKHRGYGMAGSVDEDFLQAIKGKEASFASYYYARCNLCRIHREEVESTCTAGNFLSSVLQRVVCKLKSPADATCSSWR